MSAPRTPFYPMTHDDAVEMNENLRWIAAGLHGKKLDLLFEGLINGENTTRLFREWWELTAEDNQTKYQRLCRWFALISRAWSDKVYTLRWPYYTENTTGATAATPLADLAGKTASGCYTQNDDNDFEWADEDPMTWYVRANALSLADGTMNVVAVEGMDEEFDITGNTAPVYTFGNALWMIHFQDGTYEYKSFATKQGTGMRPMACDVDPDNKKRDMTWHPTFDGSLITKDGQTYLTSGKGNSLAINVAASTGIGYARKWDAYEGLMSDTDRDWLINMWQLRHFDLENSGILEGCTSYNLDYTVAIAEENVRSVVLTTAQGANLIVGSTLEVGTAARGGQIARGKITAIETVTIDGADYSRVTLDVAADFTVTAGAHAATLPWFPGSTEDLPGHKDGSLHNCTNGKTPARISGVEVITGAYAIGLDPLWNSDYDATRDPKSIYTVYACKDSEKQASSITEDYVSAGTFQSNGTSWQYIKHFAIRNDGMLMPDALGASSTTFMKSAFYFNASSGVRAPWVFADLGDTGRAGLACAYGLAPSSASWNGRPRLSGSGKKRGEWAA